MDKDWKNALSALRDNFKGDEESEISETPVDQADDKKTQKTPLTVVIDKKGRNGKIATIIEGFMIPQSEVDVIARQLKQKLGVGGSVRDGEILIQGNHLDNIKKYLQQLNFKVK